MDIDKLQISVEATSKEASANIDDLRKALSKLGNLSKTADLSNLKTQLDKIANVNLSKISGQLNTLSSAVKTLKSSADFKNAFNPDQKATKGLGDLTDSLDRTKNSMDDIVGVSKDVAGSSITIGDAFKTTKTDVDGVNSSFEWLSQNGADELDKSFINIKNSTDEASKSMSIGEWFTRKIGESAEKSTGGLSKFTSALKRILLYRVVRAILKNIADGFKEGFESLAQYSEQANQLMSQLKTNSLYLKNSFAAMLLPVLNAVAPALQAISTWLVNVLNNLNMMFAAMRKQATYTKAIVYWQDYAKAIKKAKNATIGIDELNIAGNNSQNDFTQMFEEANVTELTPAYETLSGIISFIKDNLAEIAAIIGAILAYKLVIKIGSFITSLGNTWDKLMGINGSAGLLVKGLIGAGGLYFAFTGAKEGASELSKYLAGDSNTSLSKAMTSLVTGGVGAIVAGAAFGGPIGAVIGGLAFLVGAMVGIGNAQKEMKLDKMREEFYKGDVAIKTVIEELENYYNSMDFDKNQEWVDSIDAAKTAYEETDTAFNTMWNSIKDRDKFSDDDISALATAFNDLANAATTLNEVRFDGLMSGISSAITNNISPSLTAELGSLVDKLSIIKNLVDSQITGINEKYQNILNNIVAKGGIATEAEKKELENLRKDLSTFTVGADINKSTWEVTTGEIISKGIDAGSSLEEVQANVKSLNDAYTTYAEALKLKYIEDKATLDYYTELDKTQFGGVVGLGDEDEAAFTQSYNDQLSILQGSYNDIINQLINQYTKEMLDYALYHPDYSNDPYLAQGFKWFEEQSDKLQSLLFGWMGPQYDAQVELANGVTMAYKEYAANKEASEEQQKLVDYLISLILDTAAPNATIAQSTSSSSSGGGGGVMVTKYAEGGFPSAGQLFFANENGIPEYVGSMGNRTTVANNNMIVEGIKKGVSEAGNEEKALLRELIGVARSLLEKDTSVVVGDEAIGRANARYTTKRGKVLSKGAFADAY